MVDVVWNERVRATATILNALATAVITVGVLTPLAVRLYMDVRPPPGSLELLAAMPYICAGVAVALYFLGLWILGLMDNPQ